MKIDFINSYQYIPAGFFIGFILLPERIIPYDLLRKMDILDILFCTITGIDMVKLR